MASAIVQSNGATNFGDTTVFFTWANPTTAGNLIRGVVWWNSNSITLSSVVDAVNGAATLVNNPTTFGNMRMAMFYIENIAGGAAGNITATFSGSPGTLCISGQEVSGIVTSGALDKNAINSGAADSSPDAVTSGLVTTTTAGQSIFGCGHTEFNTTLAAGTNYTSDFGSGDRAFIEHLTVDQVAAGSIAATFTEAVNDAWMCGIMTFKTPSAGGGGLPFATQIGAKRI